MPFHYLGGVCFVAVIFVCRDKLTWNFRLPVLFYCFSGGSVVVTVGWFVYIMVCLLAGADVVSGGRCVALCVVALSKPLVKKCHTVEAL